MRSSCRLRCSIPRAARAATNGDKSCAPTAHRLHGCTAPESWARSTAICTRAPETSANAWPLAASPGAMPPPKYPGNRTGSKFAAAIGVVEALGILFRRLFPGAAAAAQRAGEVGRALFVEGLAALLAVGRHLDQQIVDQVLHVPRLVGRQIAEADDKLLHHAQRHRRHRDDMAGDLFRPLHQ